MKPLWPRCQEYIGIQLTGVLGLRNRTHLCGMAVYAKAAASQTREGKTGLREQPQIKVQTRVRVSLFVREMHGPWIWPAEVAAAHVKAEVRHLWRHASMARLPLALEAYKPPNQASSPLVLCVAASSKVAGSRAESSAPAGDALAGDATLANWQISHRRFRSGFRLFFRVWLFRY